MKSIALLGLLLVGGCKVGEPACAFGPRIQVSRLVHVFESTSGGQRATIRHRETTVYLDSVQVCQ